MRNETAQSNPKDYIIKQKKSRLIQTRFFYFKTCRQHRKNKQCIVDASLF